VFELLDFEEVNWFLMKNPIIIGVIVGLDDVYSHAVWDTRQ